MKNNFSKKFSGESGIVLHFSNLSNVWLKKIALFCYLLLHSICFNI